MASTNTSEFTFRIPLVESDETDHNPLPEVTQSLIESFQRDGFVVFPNVVSQLAVDALNDRLEGVLVCLLVSESVVKSF